ncbi:MAG: helix-turn-helix transcriptional regulator [Thermomicrobiales bacterium]
MLTLAFSIQLQCETDVAPAAIALGHARVPFVSRATEGERTSVAALSRRGGLPGSPATTIDLTAREQDILGLLAQRLTNAEIADRLFIGRRTVDTHVGNLLTKLEAPNRRQAIAIAARRGLI